MFGILVQQAKTGQSSGVDDVSTSPYFVLDFLLLLALPAQQGLCNGRASVRPSVCPIDRQQQRRPAGLLLSALRARDRSTAAGAVHAAGTGAQHQMRAASR